MSKFKLFFITSFLLLSVTAYNTIEHTSNTNIIKASESESLINENIIDSNIIKGYTQLKQKNQDEGKISYLVNNDFCSVGGLYQVYLQRNLNDNVFYDNYPGTKENYSVLSLGAYAGDSVTNSTRIKKALWIELYEDSKLTVYAYNKKITDSGVDTLPLNISPINENYNYDTIIASKTEVYDKKNTVKTNLPTTATKISLELKKGKYLIHSTADNTNNYCYLSYMSIENLSSTIQAQKGDHALRILGSVYNKELSSLVSCGFKINNGVKDIEYKCEYIYETISYGENQFYTKENRYVFALTIKEIPEDLNQTLTVQAFNEYESFVTYSEEKTIEIQNGQVVEE